MCIEYNLVVVNQAWFEITITTEGGAENGSSKTENIRVKARHEKNAKAEKVDSGVIGLFAV